MKKRMIKIFAVAIIIIIISLIYVIFIRVEMSCTTKMICNYFADIEVVEIDKEDEIVNKTNIKVNDNSTYINKVDAYPVIQYEGSFYQFTGYAINKEAVYTEKSVELCYIVDKEDIYAKKDLTKDIYELKNISLKYAFAYKNENIYYLYTWLTNGDIDIKSKMGNFDELFSEINRDGKISFYEIEVFIYNYRRDSYSHKSIMCYGDIDKFIDKYIKGQELQNLGDIVPERRYLTDITRYKTASISISGYMKDTGSAVLLSIDSDGYLRLHIHDIQIDTCFWIEDTQIEMICQYILNNFDIYPQSEKVKR